MVTHADYGEPEAVLVQAVDEPPGASDHDDGQDQLEDPRNEDRGRCWYDGFTIFAHDVFLYWFVGVVHLFESSKW